VSEKCANGTSRKNKKIVTGKSYNPILNFKNKLAQLHTYTRLQHVVTVYAVNSLIPCFDTHRRRYL